MVVEIDLVHETSESCSVAPLDALRGTARHGTMLMSKSGSARALRDVATVPRALQKDALRIRVDGSDHKYPAGYVSPR